MANTDEPERRASEVLSEADKVLIELAACVKSAKREQRRARRLRALSEPRPRRDQT
jgi:hypothetical protein